MQHGMRAGRTWQRRIGAAATAAAIALAVGANPGCATYVNYPPIGDDLAVNDPNVPPSPTLMAVALRWAIKKYDIDQPFVINLPVAMERRQAERILMLVDDPNARLVEPEHMSLPSLHVTRILLRGDTATVELLVPVSPAFGTLEGKHQPVSVIEKSRLGTWSVSATRPWPIGSEEAPPLYGWPDSPMPPADPAPAAIEEAMDPEAE